MNTHVHKQIQSFVKMSRRLQHLLAALMQVKRLSSDGKKEF